MKVTKSLQNKVDKLIELLNDKQVMNLFVEDENEVEKLCYLLEDVDEGKAYYRELSLNKVINQWNERCETLELLAEIFNSLDKYDQVDFINHHERLIEKSLTPYQSKANKKIFTSLLGLKEYATKEEIIKEITEII